MTETDKTARSGPLRGGPDIDEHAAGGYLAEGLLRGEPPQAGARSHQDLVDGTGPRRPDRHHAAAPSVSRLTSPPGVSALAAASIWISFE